MKLGYTDWVAYNIRPHGHRGSLVIENWQKDEQPIWTEFYRIEPNETKVRVKKEVYK